MFNRSRALLAAMVALASPFSSMAGAASTRPTGYRPRNTGGGRTVSAAAQRRAKIKRANIRKHPRCRS